MEENVQVQDEMPPEKDAEEDGQHPDLVEERDGEDQVENDMDDVEDVDKQSGAEAADERPVPEVIQDEASLDGPVAPASHDSDLPIEVNVRSRTRLSSSKSFTV